MIIFQLYRWLQDCIAFVSNPSKRNLIVSIVDQAIVSATGFFTGMIIGRRCSKEELGLYALGYSIIIIVSNIQTSVISSPYTTFSPRLLKKSLSLYTGSTLIHSIFLISLVIACLIVLGLSPPLNFLPIKFTQVIWALVFMIAFILIRELIRQLCFATFLMSTALYIDFTVAFCQLATLLLLANIDLLSAVRSYYIIGISCFFPSALWLYLKKNTYSFSCSEIWKHFLNNWNIGRWLLMGRILSLVSIQIYPWIISYYYGIESTAIYAACQGVVGIFTFILLGSGNYLYPITAREYSKGGPDKLRYVLKKYMFIYGIGFGVLLLFLILFGGVFVKFIYGPKYNHLGSLVAIFAISQFFLALLIPLEASLVAIERPKNTFMGHAFGFVLTISIGLWLTISFGPHGAVCGLAIYYFAVGSIFMIGLKNKLKSIVL